MVESRFIWEVGLGRTDEGRRKDNTLDAVRKKQSRWV
jgi:hypothetical protein